MKALPRICKAVAVSSFIAFSALHAEVDSAESSPESSTSVESNSAESKGFCAGAHSNTGCFVGVSVGLSPATSRLDMTDPVLIITGQPKKESVTIPLSLDVGYQWYFAQNAGFRFRGFIGYENYSAKNMQFKARENANEGNMEIELTSHALTYGLEARYLYDFIYGGEHTFGANIGFGVEGSSFFNTGGRKVIQAGSIDAIVTEPFDMADYTRVTWTSGVGLHYFYKSRHQILLSYIYRGYTDELQKGGAMGRPTQDGGIILTNARVSAFANHTIQLSYAYKF